MCSLHPKEGVWLLWAWSSFSATRGGHRTVAEVLASGVVTLDRKKTSELQSLSCIWVDSPHCREPAPLRWDSAAIP
jgi:hypothetical protein